MLEYEIKEDLTDLDTILYKLRSSIVNVKFTKKSGEIRDMRCTLLKNLLPDKYRTLNEMYEPLNVILDTVDHTNPAIKVFDLDANAFRSFNLKSIINIETEI